MKVAIESASSEGGEEHAQFEREALAHLDALREQALSLTGGNEARAQDLVQETLLKAYESWGSYEAGTNCKGWLMTILRNKFISEFRKQKRQPTRLGLDDLGDRTYFEAWGDDADPAEEFYENIIAQDVVRALEELPDHFRVTVVLSDLRDFQYQEISDQLKIPVGTVKSRLSRARRQLRDRLRPYARRQGFLS